MKQYIVIILLATFGFSIASCSKHLLGFEQPNTKKVNFRLLWQDFNDHYGSFKPKQIDWKAAYDQYQPLISDTMSNTDFYSVCTKMLDILNDNHVYLRPLKDTGLPWYAGGILGRTKVEDYDRNVVQSYLTGYQVYNNAIEHGFFAGNIGYINLLNFDNDISTYYKAMDDVLNHFKDTKGVVIDMRQNEGGEDRVAQYIANRFASEKHLSFSVSVRNGAGLSDFATPIEFYTMPVGSFQYTKPIVVLTDLNTFSAGETFVLAMLQNKNVRLIGGVTGGALSDAVKRELLNGWLYRLPIADVRDATGKNLEGIGIQPHITILNTKEDLASGHDKALEKALQVLH